jgi:hypothetical protein
MASVTMYAAAVPVAAATLPVSTTAMPAAATAVPMPAAMPAAAVPVSSAPIAAASVATAAVHRSDDNAAAPTRGPAQLPRGTAAAPGRTMTIGTAASGRLGWGGRDSGQCAESGKGDQHFSQGSLLLR